MFLLIILTVSVLSLGWLRISALHTISDVTSFFNQLCIENAPQNIQFKNDYLALVCAQNFNSLSDSQLYLSTGLIHLFVVSGAHLILLENFILLIFPLEKTKPQTRFFIFLILFLYGLFCGLEAPICRALVSMGLQNYLYNKNIIWPASYLNLIIVLVTLNLNPFWVNSLSLQLSWLAAFCVSLNQVYFSEKSILYRQMIFYIFLFPALMFLQTPQPISVLTNLFLAPVLEFVLFPLALLTYVFPFLTSLFDISISLLKTILTGLEAEFVIQTAERPSVWPWLIWLFILSLHFMVLFHEQRRSQCKNY